MSGGRASAVVGKTWGSKLRTVPPTAPPHRTHQVLSLNPGICKIHLLWEKSLCICNYTEDLEMKRLPWITRVGPKGHHKYLYKRDTKGSNTNTQRRRHEEGTEKDVTTSQGMSTAAGSWKR